jgi:hypothetical protein
VAHASGTSPVVAASGRSACMCVHATAGPDVHCVSVSASPARTVRAGSRCCPASWLIGVTRRCSALPGRV